MCLWIYKAYLCLTKTFYVEYSMSTMLKTGFSAVLSLDFVLVNFDSFSWGQFCLKLGYFFLTYLELSNLKYQTWFYLKIFFHFGTVSRQSQVNTSKISLFSRFLHFGAIQEPIFLSKCIFFFSYLFCPSYHGKNGTLHLKIGPLKPPHRPKT